MSSSTYMQSAPGSAIPMVCPTIDITDANVNDVFIWPPLPSAASSTASSTRGGVATASLSIDPTTNRPLASTVAAHVTNLFGNGTLPTLAKSPVSNPLTSGTTPETAMREFIAQDVYIRDNLKAEYCHYEARYRYALKKFLATATSGVASNNAEALRLLETTKTLNLKLNSVLEVMNYLAQQRVTRTNDLKSDVETSNATINTRLASMQNTYKFLNSNDAIVRTQREMIRYTEEKNTFNANQISLWAAANVVALAVIFYVYRS